MHLFRVETCTIQAIIAVLALLLGWARWWGWPGDLVLSVTQFPFAWFSWSVIGFLLGRSLGSTERRQERSPLLTGLLVLFCVVTFCKCGRHYSGPVGLLGFGVGVQRRQRCLTLLTDTVAIRGSSHLSTSSLRGYATLLHAKKSIVTRKSNACKAVTL